MDALFGLIVHTYIALMFRLGKRGVWTLVIFLLLIVSFGVLFGFMDLSSWWAIGLLTLSVVGVIAAIRWDDVE